MLKLIYYVPESHLNFTKTAIFNAGAGGLGHYQHCAWQVKGIGQFMPVLGAQPFLGQVGTLEQLEEWRVETLVHPDSVQEVLNALKASHPYEEPAFEFIQTVTFE